MKTTLSNRKNERANVLVIAICVTFVAGVTLASFLKLAAGQNASVARSQAWNASIPVVEAGIEEAMTHLNDNCTYTDISHPNTNSWAIDGWTTTDLGVKKKTYLPGGNSYYTVEIITAAPYSPFLPAIVSEGHMASPFAQQIVGPNPLFATIDTSINPTTTQIGTQTTNVARRVRVTAGQRGLFGKGLVAKDSIDLNGNNIATDSFDSADPSYSSNGQYDPTKHKSNGDVATDSGLINSLNVGNANIAGKVSTGPGGSVAIGANGTVGDLAWTSSHSGIQPGHSSDDMNVYFPDVKPPFNGGFSTPAGPLTLTNADRTTGTTTNTVNSYPVGQYPVITNTVTLTTPDFPAAGTYLGTPNMNTAHTTTATFPASGTFSGVVVTNTGNITSATLPSDGSYIGTPTTNTAVTTTATYPGSGTYVGNVTTNTASTNSPTYPASGGYIGTISTNTAPTNSQIFPGSGTYIGSVTTNIIATNSSSLPSGVSGTITTNYTTVTSVSYPAPGSFVPPVATNTSATSSPSYPASGSYTGAVLTNSVVASSSTPPASGTYVGVIATNTTPTTTVGYPSTGAYVGGVTTNTATTSSSSFPSAGSYVGTVTTNTENATTGNAPAPGTYIGPIQTNATLTTTTSYPSPGGYLGTITTNCGTTIVSAKTFPAAGTYCGTPWLTGNSTNNNSAWNWYALSGYTYRKIDSYSYIKIKGYTYAGITGYSYNLISGYSYNSIAGYSYNLITGYTYLQPSTYSYIAGTNYAYLLITGYNYNLVSDYTYNLITGYSYQGISSYTYDLITGWTWAKIVSYTYYAYSTTTSADTVSTYDWVLDSGNYELSSFSGKVLVRGNATLYVTDSVNFTGHDQITINPGASLKLYSAAQVATLGGNGVWNNGGNATNFSYFGLPTNQKVSISGNGSITGVIYAPEANLTLNGGGHDTTDFIGASITGTATLNGHFNFHYDEDLAKHGPAQSFVIDSWNEISLTQRY